MLLSVFLLLQVTRAPDSRGSAGARGAHHQGPGAGILRGDQSRRRGEEGTVGRREEESQYRL